MREERSSDLFEYDDGEAGEKGHGVRLVLHRVQAVRGVPGHGGRCEWAGVPERVVKSSTGVVESVC